MSTIDLDTRKVVVLLPNNIMDVHPELVKIGYYFPVKNPTLTPPSLPTVYPHPLPSLPTDSYSGRNEARQDRIMVEGDLLRRGMR
jgi:hypothetical protein